MSKEAQSCPYGVTIKKTTCWDYEIVAVAPTGAEAAQFMAEAEKALAEQQKETP